MDLITIAVIAIVVIVILISWFNTRLPKNSSPDSKYLGQKLEEEDEPVVKFAYESRGALMSPAERTFFEALRTAVNGDWFIFSKVRLEDIISVKKDIDKKEAFGLRNRIKSRHIDFLLCDKETMEIIKCIELDDKSHRQKSRQQRDEFVDQALRCAGVEIERIVANSNYSQDYIKAVVLPSPKQSNYEA